MKTKIESIKTLIEQQTKIINSIYNLADRIQEAQNSIKIYKQFDMANHISIENVKISNLDKQINRLFNSLENCNNKIITILN